MIVYVQMVSLVHLSLELYPKMFGFQQRMDGSL